jgi:hypothetical protein
MVMGKTFNLWFIRTLRYLNFDAPGAPAPMRESPL